SVDEGGGSPCEAWRLPDPPAYDNLANWGFNAVRLSISWANIEPRAPRKVRGGTHHGWNREYLDAVDEVVQQLTSRGVAVILEMSQNKWSPAFQRSDGSDCPGRGMPVWLYKGTNMNT